MTATCALAMLAGCSSGSGTHATATGSGARSGSSGAAATAHAPDALVVARLTSVAALRTAGFAATGLEDDGGAQIDDLFSSQVRTAGADGTLLTLDLVTYGSHSDAQHAYHQLVVGSSTPAVPLAGVGDEAATVGMTTYVVKGSQVLTAQGRLSQAQVGQLSALKAAGKLDPAQSLAATNAVAAAGQAVARAVAGRMTGASTTTDRTLTYLPPSAVDPCATSASALTGGGLTVAATAVVSDAPPASECVYKITGSGAKQPAVPYLAVYTLTAAQAASAVPPTTVQASFDGIRANFVGGPGAYQAGVIGDPINTLARTGTTDPDFAIDVDNVFTEEITEANGSSAPDNDTCKLYPKLAAGPLPKVTRPVTGQHAPPWPDVQREIGRLKSDFGDFVDRMNEEANKQSLEVCDGWRQLLGL